MSRTLGNRFEMHDGVFRIRYIHDDVLSRDRECQRCYDVDDPTFLLPFSLRLTDTGMTFGVRQVPYRYPLNGAKPSH